MLDFQGNILCTAVDALPVKFFQQVFANLVTCKLAMLVFYAGYIGILHQLRVGLYILVGDRTKRKHPD